MQTQTEEIVEQEIPDEPEVIEQEPSETPEATEPAEETPQDEQKPEDTPLLKDLRKMLREEKRRAREIERELQALKAPKPDDSVLPPKPKLEDVDYDSDQFAANLEAWYEKKRKVEEKQAEARRVQESAEASWRAKLDGYEKSKAELDPDEVSDGEDVVQTLFNATQQGILVQGTGALGAKIVAEFARNPAKAKALSEISDPVEFAVAVGELKASMTMTKSKAPAPEKPLSGGSRVVNSKSKLEELREAAQRSGNFDEYFAYKRKMAEK